ncbi:MAG: hypothetical protein HRU15_04330 [Planctomycetes bacterium]|nr:hypothetical protein [Planctomycetota bacterium]
MIYSDGAQLRVHAQGALKINVIIDQETIKVATFTAGCNEYIDLTEYFTCRYDGIIEFILEQGSVLKEFSFHAPIMTAPKTMPKLCVGANTLRVQQGDKQQQASVPYNSIVDLRPGSHPEDNWHSAKNAHVETFAQDWKCISPLDADKPVDLCYRIPAAEGKNFAWFHAISSVKEGPEAEAEKSAQFMWSANGTDWQDIDATCIPNSHMQWDTSMHGDIILPAPCAEIYLRIVSETAITGVEFYGHIDMSACKATDFTLTHNWQESGTACSACFENSESYEMVCESQPTNHEYIISGKSQKKSSSLEQGHI